MISLETPREMIAVGHTAEAARWVKLVAFSLPEDQLREAACMLADAILNPVPRKRGDKLGSGDKLAEIAKELAIVSAVDEYSGSRTEAYQHVGERFHKSSKTVEGYCRKWKSNAT